MVDEKVSVDHRRSLYTIGAIPLVGACSIHTFDQEAVWCLRPIGRDLRIEPRFMGSMFMGSVLVVQVVGGCRGWWHRKQTLPLLLSYAKQHCVALWPTKALRTKYWLESR